MFGDDQVDQYKTQGYGVYDRLLSEEEVRRLNDEIDSITAGATLTRHDSTRLEMEPNQPPDGTKVRRVYEPCTFYDAFREISESPKLLDCAQQLIGPDILYYYSKINMKPAEVGSVVEWHQDLAYGPLTNRSYLAVLIYLHDADLSNGCLQVIPGKFRMLDHARNGLFQGKITEALDTSKAIPIEAKRGTAIFFEGLVPHASAPNTSARPRTTLIIGYRAADAFPLHLGEMTTRGETYVRLARGQRSATARFEMDWVYVPRYPAITKSLYELQELARHADANPAV